MTIYPNNEKQKPLLTSLLGRDKGSVLRLKEMMED